MSEIGLARIELESGDLFEGRILDWSIVREHKDGPAVAMVKILVKTFSHAREGSYINTPVKSLEPGWSEPPDIKPKSKNPLAGAFA